MFGLESFYSTDPDGRPAAVTSTVLGGLPVVLRPLTVEDTFRLWSVLEPYSVQWVDLLTATDADDQDLAWTLEAFPRAVEVLWPDQAAKAGGGAAWIEATKPAELQQVLGFFQAIHSWPTILRELLGVRFGPDDGDPAEPSRAGTVDQFVELELLSNGARTVEDFLRMRPEALLAYVSALERRAIRRTTEIKKAQAESTGGKWTDWNSLGIDMPGVETSFVEAVDVIGGGESDEEPN